jgi:hypothetical protein
VGRPPIWRDDGHDIAVPVGYIHMERLERVVVLDGLF